VKNEEVLHRVKEERNMLHTVKRRKVNWIGHILGKNCLLKHDGRKDRTIEVTERRGRRHEQLLDHFKEMRRYWKLKEEALDITLWRTCFGRGCGAVFRQTTYIYVFFDILCGMGRLSVTDSTAEWLVSSITVQQQKLQSCLLYGK
jgi:hypothetical protein